ncbi:chromodomain protein [Plasmopara halstedii]|uniref:Chromodomain protein n=1 Tax=Plasmopara halstedii TaxID=4781 RepID=A0A0P1AIQ2_PLAHL|nr:chromodomain protein [Plasmopara halstedii]CEG41100.1 chromodomain protein [Plasmopara halstedii]|eukprot:XP_024577469.1 chromodomain protein [Plasmopara halstedii]
MSLDESSVLMDRALVTICQDLPESLGLYNTAKDQFSLAAIRSVPLLEHVGSDSRKFVLIRDWMRAYESAEDQPLTPEISMDSLKETVRRERKEIERKLRDEKHALLTSADSETKKKKRQRKKKKATEEKSYVKNSGKACGKKKERLKDSHSQTKSVTSKCRVQMDSDDDMLSIDESSNSSAESSLESSSSSESRGGNLRKKKKSTDNLPPKEIVLSSDEDEEEPDDMFDTADPDVYEVEKIIRKKASDCYGEPDLYEVKWEGYDETTWEPASNISKDLIDEFEGQPVREDVYVVEEILDRRSKHDPSTRLKTHQYKVKWVGYDEVTWEPAENLPHNLRRKFDQKYKSRKRRRK